MYEMFRKRKDELTNRFMVPPERFELPTPRSEDECSNPLSYGGLLIATLYLKIHDKISFNEKNNKDIHTCVYSNTYP